MQSVIQLTVIILFSFHIFNYVEGLSVIPITGYEALFKNSYYIIGNVFISVILLSSMYHLLVLTVTSLFKGAFDKVNTSLVVVINVQLFFGLFVVTFLGRYLELLGILMVALVILGAVIKHKFDV